ncbi:MAG TPA: thioredoxin family protein [Gaiellales bacterium]|nr:thioredoxin family protein [Gaiellales bacterium]
MTERLVLLAVILALAVVAHLIAWRRRGAVSDGAGDRFEPAEVGLDRFPREGAFVQFSAPACGPCRVSLNRLAEAVAHHPGTTTVVEVAVGRKPQLARRHKVRSAPTVLYVDAAGAVRRRWTRPPERGELAELLDTRQTTAV